MAASTILLLRHAEKPDERGTMRGLTRDGQEDAKSLTVRGWQRAGALAALFGANIAHLPRPDRIYASAFRDGGGHSRRPEQSVLPLAQKLGLSIDLTWALHQEATFGQNLAAQTGTSLVCWQHQGLAELARAIVAPHRLDDLPTDWVWPANRYDVVWSLQRDSLDDTWHFTQHCQCLLAGDESVPFDLSPS